MVKKIIRRFLFSILVLVGVSLIAFFLVRLAPGNPAQLMLGPSATPEDVAEMEARMGLDKPYAVQYFMYIWNVLHGDLGYSYQFSMSCNDLIFGRLPATAELTFWGFLVICVIAFPLGILAGIKKGSFVDALAIFVSLLGQAISPVWLALLLILLFGVHLGWLPTQGRGTFAQVVMPAIVMGFQFCSLATSMLRSGMMDALQQDYITASRARGVPRIQIYTKYALKNAILPVITVMGNNLGAMMAGSMVVETIFNWPGIGEIAIRAINLRDFQLVQSILLVSAAIFVIINLIVDILYTVVDKRIEFN